MQKHLSFTATTERDSSGYMKNYVKGKKKSIANLVVRVFICKEMNLPATEGKGNPPNASCCILLTNIKTDSNPLICFQKSSYLYET